MCDQTNKCEPLLAPFGIYDPTILTPWGVPVCDYVAACRASPGTHCCDLIPYGVVTGCTTFAFVFSETTGDRGQANTCSEYEVIRPKVPARIDPTEPDKVLPKIPGLYSDRYPGFTAKVINCIQGMMTDSVAMDNPNSANPADVIIIPSPLDSIVNIRNGVANLVTGALILYIMFFSAKLLLGGVRNLKGETAVVLLTMVIVTVFTYEAHLEFFIGLFLGAQEALINVVTEAIGDVDVRCNRYDSLWYRVDCTFAKLMGVNPPVDDADLGNAGIQSYLIANGTTVSFANSIQVNSYDSVADWNAGSYPEPYDLVNKVYGHNADAFAAPFRIIWGMMMSLNGMTPVLFILAVIVLLLVTVAFASAILLYLSAFIAVIFLGLIAPLIIPTFLFQWTRGIFTQWLQLLFGFILQPALVLGYLAFMVQIMSFFIDTGTPDDTSATGINGLNQTYARVQDLPEICINPDGSIVSTGADAEMCQSIAQRFGKKVVMSGCNHRRDKDGKVIDESGNPDMPGCDVNSNVGKTITGGEKGITAWENFEPFSKADPVVTNGGTLDSSNPDDAAIIEANAANANRLYQQDFLQDFLVVAVLLALTLSFMHNVMNASNLITGLTNSQITKSVDLYNKVSSRVSKVTQM